jgi:hypothetical protein
MEGALAGVTSVRERTVAVRTDVYCACVCFHPRTTVRSVSGGAACHSRGRERAGPFGPLHRALGYQST